MNFTVYSKPGCPYCTKVIQVLEHVSVMKGFQIIEKTLGQDFTRQEFYEKFGDGSTFPQVLVVDNKIGGCSDTIKYLQENNLI